MIDNTPPVQPCIIFHGPKWPEPAEIKLKSESLPHQIEGVYSYVLWLPRIRWI